PAPPTGTTYDPMADRAVERPEPPQDPRAFTSERARASGVYPRAFEPQGTQWPQYPPPPPKEVPEDKPNPLIPFSAYRSKPPTHRVGDMEKKKKNPALRKVWKDTTEPDFEDYIDNMQGGMKVKSLMA